MSIVLLWLVGAIALSAVTLTFIAVWILEDSAVIKHELTRIADSLEGRSP